MYHHNRIAHLPHASIALAIKLPQIRLVQCPAAWLIQQLNCNYDIVISPRCVFLRNRIQHAQRLLARGSIGSAINQPPGIRRRLARVVPAVLRARCAVQVDHDFEPGLARPANRFVDVCGRAGDKGRITIVVGPEANGKTDEVEACGGDLLEIPESDPGVPVLSEDAWGLGWELLAKGPFIDYTKRLV